jgi:hypothetical protein
VAQLQRKTDARPFLRPVDPERDGLAGYAEAVAQPIDLGTVQSRSVSPPLLL